MDKLWTNNVQNPGFLPGFFSFGRMVLKLAGSRHPMTPNAPRCAEFRCHTAATYLTRPRLVGCK